MKQNQLRIPKDSKLPYITVICSLIMLACSFFTFYFVNGKLVKNVICKFLFLERIEGFIIYLPVIAIPAILFVFSIIYAKKNMKMIILPMALSAAYWLFQYAQTNKLWYVVLSYTVVLLFYLLTVTNILRSKWPLETVCFLIIAVVIVLTVLHKPPFAGPLITDFDTSASYFINLSALIYFIAYFLGIGAMAHALSRIPKNDCLVSD